MLPFPVEIEQLIWKHYFKQHVALLLLHRHLSKRLIAAVQNPPLSNDEVFSILSRFIQKELPTKATEELLQAAIPTTRFLQVCQAFVRMLEAGSFLEGERLDAETRAEFAVVLIQAVARISIAEEDRWLPRVPSRCILAMPMCTLRALVHNCAYAVFLSISIALFPFRLLAIAGNVQYSLDVEDAPPWRALFRLRMVGRDVINYRFSLPQ